MPPNSKSIREVLRKIEGGIIFLLDLTGDKRSDNSGGGKSKRKKRRRKSRKKSKGKLRKKKKTK